MGGVCVCLCGEKGGSKSSMKNNKKKEAQDKAVSLSHPLALSIQNQTLHTRKQAEETLCVCVCVCPGECNTVPIFRMLDVTTAYKGHHERVRSWSEVMLVNSNPFFIFIKKAQVWVFQFSSEFKIRLFFKQQQ